ncbi:unnamed protein product [Prorocentrum cordatum]|uniref:Uncharacterized protein n=1 Tax=Prorocentrum cordatum TaxID=2364126 RepID=A0ABN9UT87_9DINO|nr:unnamed protein product [Polarella glacialis]
MKGKPRKWMPISGAVGQRRGASGVEGSSSQPLFVRAAPRIVVQMTSSSSFHSHIALNTDNARCPPCLHAPAVAVWEPGMASSSSFTSRTSPSITRARCHSSPFSQALIPDLRLSSVNTHSKFSSDAAG